MQIPNCNFNPIDLIYFAAFHEYLSVVFVLSECIYFAKVCARVHWLRGSPSPDLDVGTSDIHKHRSFLCGNVAMPQS